MKFWVHVNQTEGKLLDGGGFPVRLGQCREKMPSGPDWEAYFPSIKLTVWADRDAVTKFCSRKFKGEVIRITDDRVEVDLPADAFRPARTLAFVETEVR